MMLSYGSRVTQKGVCLFLAEHREIHRVFVNHNLPNAYLKLMKDVTSYEVLQNPELPPLIPEPYISEYALYLESLPFHKILAHWYVMYYIHRMIPDASILIESDVLPNGWRSEYLDTPDDLLERRLYEDAVRAFMPLEVAEFTEEMAEVYIRLACIVALLFK